LNTINNSPTWNDDLNYRKELTIQSKDIQKNTQRGQRGESLNFNKEALFKRLQKLRNEDLDYGKVVNEVTGDYLIEGRHGNSVRVGSRSNNPYIFISNKRGDSNVLESLSDGSLITITSNGTLAQHFPSYYDVNNEESVFGFTLSSDGNENNNYPIGTIHSDLNNGADIQDTIYGYDTNQILFNSDRITLNSKLDDIFVSSIKDIYIGSGRHLSINASTSLNVLSDNVNIGNPNKSTMESMVLGEKLQKALNAIVDLIPSIQILTQLGNQSPLPVIQKDISNVKGLIDDIISTKHKIEQG
jgi:hypothetical protein